MTPIPAKQSFASTRKAMVGSPVMSVSWEKPNMLNYYDKTFYKHVQQGRFDELLELYSHHSKSIDINWHNPEDYGYTALMQAAAYGHNKIVSWMLKEEGIDVDATNMYGNTALYWAASNGHTAILEMLLQHGACANVSNNDGVLPIDRARANHHTMCVKILEAHLEEDN
mmetsp:Transcript_2420/g.4319  ORF Transcript_2420/g.4319 Transcript_2420/m.4319 type:complete len:169 (-) Transcript_2420:71-577(-)|eukprot:CAMPEP_0184699062 /NCGR_PEP_ID=MMETSP0313-20130426/5464_1 /TAXON_ID=2792 /ORGANISM="Porphyridium aerugineum, Strain SAG 1380-2" /LENGTH=168 /DNA_ID=CAMNT_0027158089 /DNA_START=636 /DNA_END=1142 /DNA_ORIENTATION=-